MTNAHLVWWVMAPTTSAHGCSHVEYKLSRRLHSIDYGTHTQDGGLCKYFAWGMGDISTLFYQSVLIHSCYICSWMTIHLQRIQSFHCYRAFYGTFRVYECWLLFSVIILWYWCWSDNRNINNSHRENTVNNRKTTAGCTSVTER